MRLKPWRIIEALLPMGWLARRWVRHDDRRAFWLYCWIEAKRYGEERWGSLWPE